MNNTLLIVPMVTFILAVFGVVSVAGFIITVTLPFSCNHHNGNGDTLTNEACDNCQTNKSE